MGGHSDEEAAAEAIATKAIATGLEDIHSLCISMSENNLFYMHFDKKNSFRGTLHCEAYLASLLHNFLDRCPAEEVNMPLDKLSKLRTDMQVGIPFSFLCSEFSL